MTFNSVYTPDIDFWRKTGLVENFSTAKAYNGHSHQ